MITLNATQVLEIKNGTNPDFLLIEEDIIDNSGCFVTKKLIIQRNSGKSFFAVNAEFGKAGYVEIYDKGSFSAREVFPKTITQVIYV